MDISSIIKNFFSLKKKKKKTGKYCGISKQPYLKKEAHKKQFPTLHNWRVVIKFENKQKTVNWKNSQIDYEIDPDGFLF